MNLAAFDLAVRLRGGKTDVEVLQAPDPPRPIARFSLPWSPGDTAGLLEAVEELVEASILAASGAPAPVSEAAAALDLRDLGETLFRALFAGDIRRLMEARLARFPTGAEANGGLRLRLFFEPALGDIAALPWELLRHPERREFLGRSGWTPVSRFLPVEVAVGGLKVVRPPFKVALVAPAPRGNAALDFAAERDYVRRGLAQYTAVEVCDVQPPTLERLVEVLERDPEIHILHFMGHAGFEDTSGRGALLFERPDGMRHAVTGELFAEQVQECRSLRLVVLNCCQGGQAPRQRGKNPFTGVATALLWRGLPAVVAMQFSISDQAALTFAGKFYSALAAGAPVDVATALARKAIYRRSPRSLEWITPVVFLQVPDGRLLVPEEVPRPAAEPRPQEPDPAWVAALLQGLDGGAAHRVLLRLDRLARLFSLPDVLSREESQILRAAACLRSGAGLDEDEGDPAGPADFVAAARYVAAAEPGADLTAHALHSGPWRLDLLAALLRLGEIIDLDREVTAPSRPGRRPAEQAEILDWVAYLTREIRIPRSSIVQYVLDAPSPTWIDPLKRATSLRLEAAWQELRPILLGAGLVLAAAPSEVVLGAVPQPPDAVLGKLRELGRQVGKAVPFLRHLGTPAATLPLDVLLPLPGSTVTGEEVLAFPGGFPGYLQVAEEESGCEVYRRPIAAAERELVLDLADLRPTHWYRWWLYSEEIAGRFDLIRLGRLRPLSADEQQQLAAAGEPSRDDLLALGLHSRLLRELTLGLQSATAPLEEIALAHRLIVEAYEWVRQEAPTCFLLDAYRNAAIWLQNRMFPGGPPS
jgi:CHAT domain